MVNSYAYPYSMDYNQLQSSLVSNLNNSLNGSQGAPIRVNGIESVKQFPTVPNSTVVLFDANEDIFYVKKTDASNYPTIKTYTFQELKPVEEKKIEYVTLEEFNKFKEELLNGKQHIQSE